MQIYFYGASGTVTGSCYQLFSQSGVSVIVDCGMFQGSSELEARNTLPFPDRVANASALLLTHAHLDHCGRIPQLLLQGFRAPIYLTAPTAAISTISLYDTAKIGRQDPDKPMLFTKQDVEETCTLFQVVTYDKAFRVGPFEITYTDAGHILGSASLTIVDHSATGSPRTIVFSGDLGNTPQDLIHPTKLLNHADIVVMESTYGGQAHPIGNPIDTLCDEINHIEEKGGTLLVPAFSIQRSQELLHALTHLKEYGRIQETTPVFFDSPMGERVTQVFYESTDFCNDEFQSHSKRSDPFVFPGLTILDRKDDREHLAKDSSCRVIIAGSGMMSGGRIVGHAARLLGRSDTRLLIVGYQGEGTLGRALASGEKAVVIDGQEIDVRATVTAIRTMSSHADEAKLCSWFGAIKGVTTVILTHGEDTARAALASRLHEEFGGTLAIHQPKQGDVIECT